MSGRVFFAAISLCLTLSMPAGAQVASTTSFETQRFVTVATTAANFIDEAGRTAIANGASKAAQAFARSALIEQDIAQSRLKNWVDDVQLLETGRSATTSADALTGLPAPFDRLIPAAPTVFDIPLAETTAGRPVTKEQQATLEDMQALSGTDFNRAYRTSQRQIYETLLATYDSYARGGDDIELRSVAAKELPSIRKQLGRLKGL